MKCIDFDSHFNKYVQRWMTENRAKYKNVDEMEAQMPDVYLKWINLPAEWLDGQTPALYFEQYADAAMLCKWMLKYIRSSIALPDQLMERIAALGEAAVEPLMEIAFDREQSDEARMSALGTLEQIQSPRPMGKLIELIVHARGEESEMSNLAGEMLAALGEQVMPPVVEAMLTARPESGLVLLDVACNFPGDARVYDYAVKLLRSMPDRRALIASYLGKLGDARAIDELMPLLELQELNYLDYLEIRDAIEELGGEVKTEREFAGDEYYESMKNM